MHHFAYRDGLLHAEDASLVDIAHAVGTPFYAYSTATLERHYKVFTEAFADARATLCYALEGQFQPGGDRHLRQARRRRRHRLRRRIEARAGGRHRAAQDRVLRRRQDPRGDGRGARRRGDVLQRRERAGTAHPLRGGGEPRRRRADLDPRQSGRRRQDPRQDLDRQVGEQVRHPDLAGAGGLPPRRRPAGPAHHRRRHAYRQPDHGSHAVRQCHRAAGRARPRPDGGRAPADPSRPRRRPGRALCRRRAGAAAAAALCRSW